MKSLKFYIIALSALLVFVCCSSSGGALAPQQEVALDYTSSDLWYELPTEAKYPADVFYVLPTSLADWVDESGEVQHYADVYNEQQRAAMAVSYELGQQIFGADNCNYYAPYYRQVTLDTWLDWSLVEERLPNAMIDVNDAFDYYMEHFNNGRPFILAGFSQGAKCIQELMKGLSEAEYSRMIAAYSCGFSVVESDLVSYKTIKAAQSADDLGVTICYNSAESEEGMTPILPPSAICINPVSWSTGEEPAQLEEGVTVHINKEQMVLFVEGYDSADYYRPALSSYFPIGNYHSQELIFYQDYLTANVADRVEAYMAQ